MDDMFRKHSSQLLGIFWEAVGNYVNAQGHLNLGLTHCIYMATRVVRSVVEFGAKGGAFPSLMGYIDGSMIAVA